MTTALRAAACAALLATTGLHAQTEDAAPTTTAKRTFIPTGSSLVFRMDGLAALKERFGQTNFGRMITGEEIGQMIDGFAPMIEAGLQDALPPEIGDMLGELGNQLLNYDGTMTISLRISPELFQQDLSNPMPDDIFPHVLFVAAMTPNAGQSVDDIATAFRDLLDMGDPPPLETLDVAGGLDAVMAPDGSAGFVFPTVVDGSLVVALGGNLESSLKPLLEQREEMPLSVFGDNASTSGLLAHMDLDFVGTAVMAAMEMSGELDGEMMQILPQIGRLVGFSSMNAMNLRVRPFDEFLVSEIEVLRTPSDERGLMDLMITDGQPKLADWMLRDHPSSTVVGFDVSGLPGVMTQVLGMLPPEAGAPPMEVIESMITEETGYDLRTQILGGLTGEFMVLDDSLAAMGDMFEDLEQGIEPGDPMDALGYTFAIGLRDAAAYEKMFEDLLRKAGLHVQRSRVEYQGLNLSRFDLIGPLELGFVDGALVIGVGNRGTSTMRRVIDRALAVKSGEASTAWPDDIAKRLNAAEGGWSGLVVQRAGGVFDMLTQVTQMADQMGGGDPELDMMMPFLQVLGSIGPLFEKYGVDTSVVVQKFTPSRILSQAIN